MHLESFKAYDIRGKVPEELNSHLAYKIAVAYANQFKPKEVIVGRDIRLESETLANAVIQGLTDCGVNVIDIGLCGTEEVYFKTFYSHSDGGIMVTASHNPKGHNGLKMVTKGAKPVSANSGLKEIEQRILKNNLKLSSKKGKLTQSTDKKDYINYLLSLVDTNQLKPLKIVMNVGNGSAGAVIKQITERLPFDCIYLHDTPDGNFPNGVPNPLLPENRAATIQALKQHNVDFGIAWDGDFDRCFFFDEKANFIEGYYLVGLLAETLLAKKPGAKIIYDSRLTWNTIEQVRQAQGIPIRSKTGHSFIKESMRKEDAIYGGEMSAHHYFKDFSYCDSGMLPWLLIAELISKSGKSLSQLVSARMEAFPCSGELNFLVKDASKAMDLLINHFKTSALSLDKMDGVSMEFSDWRMNIRNSNTEPYLRLNVESKGNKKLVWDKVKEIEDVISNNINQT